MFLFTITYVEAMHSAFIIEAVFIILIHAQTAGAWLTTVQKAQMSKTGCGQNLRQLSRLYPKKKKKKKKMREDIKYLH